MYNMIVHCVLVSTLVKIYCETFFPINPIMPWQFHRYKIIYLVVLFTGSEPALFCFCFCF